jgi:ubiquinone/menaquinone biosynthesis C-methylase UbiE
MKPKDHWQKIYATRAADDVGWYELDPMVSRTLVADAVAKGARSVIDIGGGASRLVDHLLDLEVERIAVVDISANGLEVARKRLGDRAARVRWIVADVTTIRDLGRFDVWHDRAVFHFLIEEADRQRYVRLAERTIRTGGVAIMATFAADGPERCSGLPVRRYDPEELDIECGPGFRLEASSRHLHTTPLGLPQSYQYSTFRRLDLAAAA